MSENKEIAMQRFTALGYSNQSVFDAIENELRMLFGNTSADLFSEHFKVAAKYLNDKGGVEVSMLSQDLYQTVEEVRRSSIY